MTGSVIEPRRCRTSRVGYALRRAALAPGLRGEGTSFTKLHEVLGREQAQFQELTRDLAIASDRIVRKHGRTIIDKQFAIKSLTDQAFELEKFAWDTL